MRAAEQSYKYMMATFALTDVSFHLFDANHTLLGTPALDPGRLSEAGDTGRRRARSIPLRDDVAGSGGRGCQHAQTPRLIFSKAAEKEKARNQRSRA
jgi:hypothetical protein